MSLESRSVAVTNAILTIE